MDQFIFFAYGNKKRLVRTRFPRNGRKTSHWEHAEWTCRLKRKSLAKQYNLIILSARAWALSEATTVCLVFSVSVDNVQRDRRAGFASCGNDNHCNFAVQLAEMRPAFFLPVKLCGGMVGNRSLPKQFYIFFIRASQQIPAANRRFGLRLYCNH